MSGWIDWSVFGVGAVAGSVVGYVFCRLHMAARQFGKAWRRGA